MSWIRNHLKKKEKLRINGQFSILQKVNSEICCGITIGPVLFNLFPHLEKELSAQRGKMDSQKCGFSKEISHLGCLS